MECYISQQKNQLLDSLENQVRFSQLVAVLVGATGLGKSFLIQKLQQRLSQDVIMVNVDASLAMTQQQLEKTISLQLGLSWGDSSTNLAVQIKNDLSQKVLITVDDADLLSIQCLNYILQLNQEQQTFQESVLFVLLVGADKLASHVSDTEIFKQHQDICVVFQIEPILQEETQAIVSAFNDHTLNGVVEPCEDKKLSYLWQLSKGNPGELNYHLSRWQEKFLPTEVVEITVDDKTSYIKASLYILFAVSLLMVLFYQQEINGWINKQEKTQEYSIKEIVSKTEKLSDNKKTMAKRKIASERNEESIFKNKHDKTKKIIDNVASTQVKLESNDEIGELIQTIEMEENKKIESSKKIAKIENTKKKSVNTDLLDGDLSDRDLPDSNLQDLDSELELELETEIEKNIPILSEDEIFLQQQSDNLFMLQWVGLSQLEAAKKYKLNHSLNLQLYVYRRNNNDKLLYLVISGPHPTHAAAAKAIKEYKLKGYKNTPWVKSMKAIKKEIKDFQQLNKR